MYSDDVVSTYTVNDLVVTKFCLRVEPQHFRLCAICDIIVTHCSQPLLTQEVAFI